MSTDGKQLPLCDACDDTGIFNEPQDSLHLEHKPVPCPFCYAPDYDPTPWCSGCGAMRKADCKCGPLADNE